VSKKAPETKRTSTAQANAAFLARHASHIRPVGPSEGDAAAQAPPAPSKSSTPLFDTSDWPAPELVASKRIAVVERIPPGALTAVAQAYEWTLALVVSGPSKDESWHLLWCFAKCVLARPPRHADVASVLIRRSRDWMKGNVAALWEEALVAIPRRGKKPNQPTAVDDDMLPGFLHSTFGGDVDESSQFTQSELLRVLKTAHKGFLAKAMGQMGAATPLAPTAEAAAELQRLHPYAPPIDVDALFEPDASDASVPADASARSPSAPVRHDPAAATAPPADLSDAIPLTPAPPPPVVETHGAPSQLPADLGSAPSVSFSKKAVMKSLKSFKLGSSGGPSGLTSAHLLSLCRVAAAAVSSRLVDVTNIIIAGHVKHSWRRYFFGASLSALAKKAGGIRPIACGETLRRLAAKTLCAGCKNRARELFLAVGQFGVGVAGGIEGLIHGARRIVAKWSHDANARKIFVKLDIANAFNSVSREFIFRAVREFFPDLEGYVRAAYADHTCLFFGDFLLSSAAGVQQGDPLGPLLFSAVLLWLWQVKPSDIVLDFCGFFLDDGNVGGDMDQVAAFVRWFSGALRAVDLTISRTKCEVVIPSPGDPLPTELDGFERLSPDAWFLLGAPCGSEEFVHTYIEKVLRKGMAKCNFVAELSDDPHAAYALLKYCSSFCLTVFYARTSGLAPAYAKLDEAVRACFSRLVVAVDAGTIDDVQLSLPLRHAGFGLRRSADFAALGFLCSSAASMSLFAHMGTIPLEDEVPLLQARQCSRLATFPAVQAKALDYSAAGGAFGDKKQRDLSQEIDDCVSARLVAHYESAGDIRSLARLSSCSAKGASAWLAMTFVAHADFNPWLSSSQFVVNCRRRLGHALSDAPTVCSICHGPMHG
jgi:hypothetical protein